MLRDVGPRKIARADHNVRAVQSRDDCGCERSIVLAICVDRQHGGSTFLEGSIKSGSQRRALPSILVELDSFVGHRSEQLPRSISGTIVHTHDPGARKVQPHGFRDLCERWLRIVRGKDYY
jgi:hypothetical protein